MKKTILALAIVAAAGIGTAQAAPVSTGGVFTMYSGAGNDTAGVVPGGGVVGVDTTITGFVDATAGTWGVSSAVPFFGFVWTASNGTLVTTAGTYALTNLNTVPTLTSVTGPCPIASDGSMCFTVGANQVAGLIDFAWNTTTGIRVVEVWNVNANGSLTAAVVPAMENGAFPGFNAAFTLTAPGLVAAVPVPAAVWLLGSGLLGLVGVARRRKALAA